MTAKIEDKNMSLEKLVLTKYRIHFMNITIRIKKRYIRLNVEKF